MLLNTWRSDIERSSAERSTTVHGTPTTLPTATIREPVPASVWTKIHTHPYMTYVPRFEYIGRKARFSCAGTEPYDDTCIFYNSDWIQFHRPPEAGH